MWKYRMKHNLNKELFCFSAFVLIQRQELKRMGIKKLLFRSDSPDIFLLKEIEAELIAHLRRSTHDKKASLAYLQTGEALENLNNYKYYFSTPKLKHLHLQNCFIYQAGEFPMLISFIRDKADKSMGHIEGYILLPRTYVLFKEKSNET